MPVFSCRFGQWFFSFVCTSLKLDRYRMLVLDAKQARVDESSIFILLHNVLLPKDLRSLLSHVSLLWVVICSATTVYVLRWK